MVLALAEGTTLEHGSVPKEGKTSLNDILFVNHVGIRYPWRGIADPTPHVTPAVLGNSGKQRRETDSI